MNSPNLKTRKRRKNENKYSNPNNKRSTEIEVPYPLKRDSDCCMPLSGPDGVICYETFRSFGGIITVKITDEIDKKNVKGCLEDNC
ncbi:hypothetical protein OIU84_017743 [Salix udensis]|uniref:Uncharacterized protein n=1 Tax=Salix udensis TaxID=889485 RepID=A0AAD6L2M3_9ROSI|nr:hypothetical protein OIU84_017743 [Salix udensis]